MTDLELWKKMKSGSQAGLKQIYDQQAASLLGYAKRLGADDGLAHDCLHDLFVYIWNRRKKLTDTDSIGRYLAVALRRRVIDKLQAKKRRQDLDSTPEIATTLTADAKLNENESNLELQQNIKKAFKHLTERQQEAIYLKFFKEMGYRDIAEVMEISYQSVRNLVYTGLQTLREHPTIFKGLIFMLYFSVQNDLLFLI